MNDEPIKTGCPSAEELSAELDGDLAPERAAAIAAHLAGCPACQKARAELEELVGGLAALGQSEPERDLFPAIARRHRQAKEGGLAGWLRRFWALPVAAAAGAVAAVLIVWLVAAPAGRSPAGQAAGPVQALAAVMQAEQTYATAVDDLERAVTAEQGDYPEAVRKTLDQGLAEIDRTIERCRQALRQAPDDLQAHQSMLAAYQHKVDFLTELLGDRL